MSFASQLYPAPCAVSACSAANAITSCPCGSTTGSGSSLQFISGEDALISNDVVLSFDPTGTTPTVVTVPWSGVTRITYRASVEPNGASFVTFLLTVFDPVTSTVVYSNTQTGAPTGIMTDDVLVDIAKGQVVEVASANTGTGGSFTILAGAVLTLQAL